MVEWIAQYLACDSRMDTVMTTSSVPQRLYLMQVDSFPPNNVPVVCYLVQTSDGTNILIDSGMPAQLPLGEELVRGKNVIEQLALLGLQPDDIDLLIISHFDLDHIGNNEAFTRAEYVVQRTHYHHALDQERFANGRSHWDQPITRFRFVDGDTVLLPGLELIETSGHTPGHQAVLVRLPETGAVLLTIDAVAEQGSFTTERQIGSRDDPEKLIASTRKLLDLVEREQVGLVVFGHDTEQWQMLRKAPEYYG
jgi:N-acyl homoserine lactone hydrolase